MNIVAIIPARGGSKGLPHKNILNFYKKPLVSWSIVQALQCSAINCGVYVSSDSDTILDVATQYGAIPIKRPDELSNDIATSESALIHTFEQIPDNHKIDAIVFLQATSPLRESIDISNAISTFNSQKLDSLFSTTESEDCFIWKKENNQIKPINFDYKNRKRRQDISGEYLENGSFYIFKPSILLKYKNRLGGKIGSFVMAPWKKYQIDSEYEFLICESLFKSKINNQKKCSFY